MIRRRNTWIANYACILSLLCVFIIGALVMMNVGVHVYKNTIENNAENFRLRASLSYVATKVRQYDTVDSVQVQEEEGIPVLILKETLDTGIYETRIYCYEGRMMELFQEQNLEHHLEDGIEVMELEELSMEMQGKSISLIAKDGEQKEEITMSLRAVS